MEFEFSEYTILESVGMLNVTLLLMGRTQPMSFNVTVIANDTGSSSAIGNFCVICISLPWFNTLHKTI